MYLDGPGTRDMVLPTMNVTALTAVIEDNTTLDVSTLAWSRQGIIRKATHATAGHVTTVPSR